MQSNPSQHHPQKLPQPPKHRHSRKIPSYLNDNEPRPRAIRAGEIDRALVVGDIEALNCISFLDRGVFTQRRCERRVDEEGEREDSREEWEWGWGLHDEGVGVWWWKRQVFWQCNDNSVGYTDELFDPVLKTTIKRFELRRSTDNLYQHCTCTRHPSTAFCYIIAALQLADHIFSCLSQSSHSMIRKKYPWLIPWYDW